MSKFLSQLLSIKKINDEIISNNDLPEEQNSIAKIWIQNPSNSSILSKSGIFSDYWIITKTTDSSSEYKLYCGENVQWKSFGCETCPEMIYIFENNKFKGILIGKTISDLIKIGAIYNWKINIFYSSSSSVPSPIGYISAGGTLLGISPGTKVQHINHTTGQISDINFGNAPIPNQIPGICHISSNFQRTDTMFHTQQSQRTQVSDQDRLMRLMNTPGVSLGSIAHGVRYNLF